MTCTHYNSPEATTAWIPSGRGRASMSANALVFNPNSLAQRRLR